MQQAAWACGEQHPVPIRAIARIIWALTLAAVASSAWSQCLTTVPAGFPEVDQAFQTEHPQAPTTTARQARIALGQRLFHDSRLSAKGTVSCATCHQPDHAFADPRDVSIGVLGTALPFNAPTLHNAALKYSLHWQANGPERLARQHALVLTSSDPVEMGFSAQLLQPHNADPQLLEWLAQAQLPANNDDNAVQQRFDQRVVQSLLAAYVSTLVCATPFDRLVFAGDASALNDQQRRGLALFTSAPRNCHHCHQGPLLGGGLRTATVQWPAPVSVRMRNDKPVALNTPALRQVVHTAPYFFDGSVKTLTEVLQQYADGRFPDLPGFAMSPEQQQALLAFLGTL